MGSRRSPPCPRSTSSGRKSSASSRRRRPRSPRWSTLLPPRSLASSRPTPARAGKRQLPPNSAQFKGSNRRTTFMADQQKIVDDYPVLTVLEAWDPASLLEERGGVSAPAAIAAAAVTAASAAPEA